MPSNLLSLFPENSAFSKKINADIVRFNESNIFSHQGIILSYSSQELIDFSKDFSSVKQSVSDLKSKEYIFPDGLESRLSSLYSDFTGRVHSLISSAESLVSQQRLSLHGSDPVSAARSRHEVSGALEELFGSVKSDDSLGLYFLSDAEPSHVASSLFYENKRIDALRSSLLDLVQSYSHAHTVSDDSALRAIAKESKSGFFSSAHLVSECKENNFVEGSVLLDELHKAASGKDFSEEKLLMYQGLVEGFDSFVMQKNASRERSLHASLLNVGTLNRVLYRRSDKLLMNISSFLSFDGLEDIASSFPSSDLPFDLSAAAFLYTNAHLDTILSSSEPMATPREVLSFGSARPLEKIHFSYALLRAGGIPEALCRVALDTENSHARVVLYANNSWHDVSQKIPTPVTDISSMVSYSDKHMWSPHEYVLDNQFFGLPVLREERMLYTDVLRQLPRPKDAALYKLDDVLRSRSGGWVQKMASVQDVVRVLAPTTDASYVQKASSLLRSFYQCGVLGDVASANEHNEFVISSSLRSLDTYSSGGALAWFHSA